MHRTGACRDAVRAQAATQAALELASMAGGRQAAVREGMNRTASAKAPRETLREEERKEGSMSELVKTSITEIAEIAKSAEADSWWRAGVASAGDACEAAQVDARWREWAESIGKVIGRQWAEVERRLKEAEAARMAAVAEAAEAKAEVAKARADRAEMESEWEGVAAALVRLSIESQEVASVESMQRLPVVEACWEEEDVGTQTEIGVTEQGCQTDPTEEVMEGGECRAEGKSGTVEVVVGRQLHPAQARAVERAERAAAQVERMQVEMERVAGRYRASEREVAGQVESAARGQQGVSLKGGRQVKKARLRRQAAAAGMDVLSWTLSKGSQDNMEVGAWRQPMGQRQTRSAYVGEAEASRRFWQAAQSVGISVLDGMGAEHVG